jgi:hypothetical protein
VDLAIVLVESVEGLKLKVIQCIGQSLILPSGACERLAAFVAQLVLAEHSVFVSQMKSQISFGSELFGAVERRVSQWH